METPARPWESHPSLDASLQDFETPYEEAAHFDFDHERLDATARTARRSPPRSPHSHTDMASDAGESDSTGPWSPPAWRRHPPSGWFQPHEGLLSPSAQHSPARSRQSSPEEQRQARQYSPGHDADTTLLPETIPLPGSPLKGRSVSPSPEPLAPAPALAPEAASQNYIRFAVRAEVQHRTEPIEAVIVYLRQLWLRVSSSPVNVVGVVLALAVAYVSMTNLMRPMEDGPGPDLVKVAGLARSFEPLIHFSEHGSTQIGELQETGVAVWDLGESVRYSNMTSAAIITQELDDLSENLKTLAMELTRFFANVDGDVDSILIVMEWAKRELQRVSGHLPTGTLGSAYENLYRLTHRFGGPLFSSAMEQLFGQTYTQRTRTALRRTFDEFLNVMEESINTELQYSTALFALFESIDQQFLNLQRSVIRESDSQEQQRDAELASLWRRLTGPNTQKMAKFERNKRLLLSVRERTVSNKLVLLEHNGKLLQLKSNLEILRKRIVSPLLRANDSSTLSLEEQIGGLDGTYALLRAAREKQKTQLTERFYGLNHRREAAYGSLGGGGASAGSGGSGREIDGA